MPPREWRVRLDDMIQAAERALDDLSVHDYIESRVPGGPSAPSPT